ncbi:MAG: integration host factor subunit beta [Candidatus Tectomicrobia bacterium]|nr:integration host factor subunit beta [Candidatus Tectomicrobia bacterium]
MTKAELVTQVALKTELTKQQTAEVIDLLLECIIEALQAGDKVELRGFGSFRRRDHRPRQGRNPKTGEAVEVSAQTVPFFKAGKMLQARLNPELAPSSSLA